MNPELLNQLRGPVHRPELETYDSTGNKVLIRGFGYHLEDDRLHRESAEAIEELQNRIVFLTDKLNETAEAAQRYHRTMLKLAHKTLGDAGIDFGDRASDE